VIVERRKGPALVREATADHVNLRPTYRPLPRRLQAGPFLRCTNHQLGFPASRGTIPRAAFFRRRAGRTPSRRWGA